MIRTSLLAALFVMVAAMPSYAAEPVRGVVKGTKTVGQGVVQGADKPARASSEAPAPS